MTAVCCADADDGKPHQGLHCIGRVDRGGFADANADRARVGAVTVTNVFAVTNTNPHIFTDTNALAVADSHCVANADTNAEPNRRGFQRGID